MRTLWTFGDSYTAEYQYHNNDSYTKYKEFKGYEIKTWPEILAEKLGTFLQNKGTRGSSNYDILKSFMENFKSFNENDIVIIGWGLVTKFNYVINDNMVSIDPNTDDEFLKKIVDNRKNFKWQHEVQQWMGFISSLCQSQNIKINFWSSEDPILIYSDEYKKYFENKDNRRILSFDSKIGLIFDLISKGIQTIDKETNGLIPDCHLGEDGHVELANLFYNQIYENRFL